MELRRIQAGKPYQPLQDLYKFSRIDREIQTEATFIIEGKTEKKEEESQEKEKPPKEAWVTRTVLHRSRDITMPKNAFEDPQECMRCGKRTNFIPQTIVVCSMLTATICILGTVGSSYWLKAEVNGLTVYYGLFELCAIDQDSKFTVCFPFDWPAWLSNTSQEKMYGIKMLAILSIFFSCVFLPGALLLLLTSQCQRCHGWFRKASFIVVDICLWLMMTSAGVSSLLFLSSVHGVQAYPDSSLQWPPIVFCVGWLLAFFSRLLVAACCDPHGDQGHGDPTLPFV